MKKKQINSCMQHNNNMKVCVGEKPFSKAILLKIKRFHQKKKRIEFPRAAQIVHS